MLHQTVNPLRVQQPCPHTALNRLRCAFRHDLFTRRIRDQNIRFDAFHILDRFGKTSEKLVIMVQIRDFVLMIAANLRDNIND
ncbi:hypothetical protein D3C85_1720070 [compost metagenome]